MHVNIHSLNQKWFTEHCGKKKADYCPVTANQDTARDKKKIESKLTGEISTKDKAVVLRYHCVLLC